MRSAHEDVGNHRVALHHALGRTATILVPAAGALAVWPRAGEGGDSWRAAAVVAAVTCVLVVVAWRPAVVIGDTALVLRNPWRDVHLPWSCVEDVHMGWVLEVTAQGRVHRGWGAPGPRRMRDMRDLDWTGDVVERYAAASVDRAARQGHGALGSADAAMLTAQRWAARGALEAAGRPSVRTRIVPVVLAGVAVTLMLAAGLAP